MIKTPDYYETGYKVYIGPKVRDVTVQKFCLMLHRFAWDSLSLFGAAVLCHQ